MRATYSAYSRIPIRWRLAGGSAALTLVILLGFAAIVFVLTSRQIHSDFNQSVSSTADDLARRIIVRPGEKPPCVAPATAENSQIRVTTLDGLVLCQTDRAPDLGAPREGTVQRDGYRVETREIRIGPLSRAVVQYGRPYSDVDHTVDKVRVFLVLGVLGGAALALLAGLAIARGAMAPIARLTHSAREIELTRDPSRRLPLPENDDEVAELARTLDEMLVALDAARGETEATLDRQRAFVADASHELRTPLTSVLANLELLAEQLDGEQGESARSALRSSRRMKRLVADLLLLARADAGRAASRRPTDLAEVLTEAAAELEPVTDGHEVTVDAEPTVVSGARDELHRLAANLIENAINHTPPGTSIRAEAHRRNGDAILTVTDNGPGVPADLAPRVFERFVRGGGERAGSSGLGLAIVRAVAESHGGSVALEPVPDGGHGARFVVRLPAERAARSDTALTKA